MVHVMHHEPMLIDLYGCAAEPTRWPRLLDRLCHETGACSAVVQSFAFGGERTRFGWQLMDSQTLRREAVPQLHLANQDNPRLDPGRSLRGLHRVVGDGELFDRDDPAREILQRRLARIGMGHFLGTLQPLAGERYLGLALHRPIGDARDFNSEEIARLERLAPHLRQACELASELHGVRASLTLLHDHLDRLRCGLMVCDREAQVQWTNRRARELSTSAGEMQVHAGRLRARRSGDTAMLHGLIAEANDEPCFVALGDGARTVHLALRAEGESVLVAITRSGDTTGVPVDAWCTLLHVSPAEAALVSTLAEGGTVELHARQRGVSLGTVRGQLKQVLAKTGTSRQAELVRLAMSSAAVHLLGSVPNLHG